MGAAPAAVARIGLAAIGSRGDVQPFLALGAALRARGHDVLLASSENFRSAALDADLRFHPVTTATPEDVLADPEFTALLRTTTSAARIARAMPKPTVEQTRGTLAAIRDATSGLDLVVHTPHTRAAVLTGPPARWCTAALWPTTPTRAMPAFGFPSLGRWGNRLTYRVLAAGEWRFFREAVNGLRAEAGLAPLRRSGPVAGHIPGHPVLHPFSSAVFPVPRDWPSSVHVTGYWFADDNRGPSAELAEFVADGPPPVVATFGSAWQIDPERTVDVLLTAATRAGRRLVVVDGPVEDLPDGVVRAHDVDFGWLFPRSAAVVHHGGQGTTAAALRAGVPQVVVPSFADQPYWAHRCAVLGVAVPPIAFPELDAARLTDALHRVRACADRARELAVLVNREPGVARACEVLEACLPAGRTVA